MTYNTTPKFLVPSWLVGSERHVLQALPVVAKAWAESYQSNGLFPSLSLIDVNDLDVILYDTSDYTPRHPAARLFLNRELIWMIGRAIGVTNKEQLKTDYETHVGGSAWGSFENILFYRFPASLTNIERRYRQLLPHLNTFANREVVSVDQQRLMALAILDQRIGRTLVSWGAPVGQPLDARIRIALDAMSEATPVSIDNRIVQNILQLVPRAPRVQHPERFSPEFVRQWITSLEPRDHENLTGCDEASLISEIITIDREP